MNRLVVWVRRWRRELVVVAACLVLTNAVAAVYLWQAPRYYEARKDVFVATSSQDSSTTYLNGFFSQTRVQSYTGLARSPAVLAEAASEVDARIRVGDLGTRVTATVPPQTVVLQITAQDTRRARAAALANAIAEIVAERGNKLEGGGAKPATVQLVVLPGTDIDSAVSPEVGSVLTLAQLAGLLLAFGFLAAMTMRRPRVESERDLTASLGLMTLAGVSELDPRALLDGTPSMSIEAMEELRILRTQLEFAMPTDGSPVLVLAPAGPSESVAELAIGVAVVLAESSRSVVLVDGDLRGRALSRLLGVDDDPGLADAVLRPHASHTSTSPTSPSFEVLGAGHRVPSPTDLLGSQSLAVLLRELQQRFDHVVVVAPPATPTTDAALWGRIAGGTLVVARGRGTTYADLATATERLSQAHDRTIGVVLVAD